MYSLPFSQLVTEPERNINNIEKVVISTEKAAIY